LPDGKGILTGDPNRSIDTGDRVSYPIACVISCSTFNEIAKVTCKFLNTERIIAMFHKIGFALISAAVLAACTPKDFESEPVMVETPEGAVTCQLYTKGLTDWDRSVDHPATMSVAVADSYCKREGQAK
jgi:hypothetical protein